MSDFNYSHDRHEYLARIAERGFVVESPPQQPLVFIVVDDSNPKDLVRWELKDDDRVAMLLAMKNRWLDRIDWGEYQQGYRDAIKDMYERLEAMS